MAHSHKLKRCSNSLGNDRPIDDGQMEHVDKFIVPLPEVDVTIHAAGDSGASFGSHAATEDSDS